MEYDQLPGKFLSPPPSKKPHAKIKKLNKPPEGLIRGFAECLDHDFAK